MKLQKDVAIRVEGVSKKFCRNLKRSMRYGFEDVLRDTLCIRLDTNRLRPQEFWALDELSFEVGRGERFGVIGPNGSGKTTLLKLLNGILRPDKGKITVRGRVGALIAIGAGFHPQLTGRENIYINGTILGMKREQINKKFDSIVEFADIGDFLDTPVKYYSSGMFVKLGFSVAAHCQPDILLVDEVLAVGDISFQAKCLDRLGELRKNGVTIILVSHHMPKIGSFCERVLYLSCGKVRLLDNPNIVINAFENEMYKSRAFIRTNGSCCAYVPLGGAKIENFAFEQKRNGEIRIQYGQPISFNFDYDLLDKDIDDCAFAVLVKRVSDGVMCFGALSNFNGFRIAKSKGRIKISINEHNLVPGLYNLDIQIRTICHDTAYTAHREPKLIVTYPHDRYILQNIAGIFQPNKIIWQHC